MAVVLGFALIIMIPMSQTVFAKPVFDGSDRGEFCYGLYGIITEIENKQAELKKQGKTLSQSQLQTLSQARGDYERDCSDYGNLETKPTSPQGNLNEDLAVEQQPSKPTSPQGSLNDKHC